MLRSIKFSILLVAILALTFVPAAVQAAGISVQPIYTPTGAAYLARVDGFNPGENVAMWITLPNLSTHALETKRADSAGSVESTVRLNQGWPNGEYIFVAHGLSSNREYFTKFNVFNQPEQPSPSTSYIALPAPVGLTLYYRGWGYGSRELVSAWFHFPNGQAQSLPSVYADANGNVVFPFTVQRNWTYGGYHISAQGTKTQRLTYNTFSWFGTITDHRAYSLGAPNLPVRGDVWQALYWNNMSLSGSAAFGRYENSIDHNWGEGSPDKSVAVNRFSARWQRNPYLNAGVYRFTVTADDGVRVWVDNVLIIDQWHDQGPTTYTADRYLAAGTHSLRVEYYENTGGAQAHFSWAAVPAGAGIWHGQYFNNTTLAGSPSLVRDDVDLNFNWGTGGPGGVIRSDYFSAKWDTTRNVPTSRWYTFYATSDDGVRVWIDGRLVIDAWYDHGPTTQYATVYLTAGQHRMHVEYYERTGGAMIRVGVLP